MQYVVNEMHCDLIGPQCTVRETRLWYGDLGRPFPSCERGGPVWQAISNKMKHSQTSTSQRSTSQRSTFVGDVDVCVETSTSILCHIHFPFHQEYTQVLLEHAMNNSFCN